MHTRRFSPLPIVFSSVLAFAHTTTRSNSQAFAPTTEEISGPVKVVISPPQARVLAEGKQRFKCTVSNARYYRQVWCLEFKDGRDATNKGGSLVWGLSQPYVLSGGSNLDSNLKEDECDYHGPHNPPKEPAFVILKILRLKSNDEIARCTVPITTPEIEIKLDPGTVVTTVGSKIRVTATAKNVSDAFYFNWYLDRPTGWGEKYHPINQVYKDGTLTATADVTVGTCTSRLELSVYLMDHDDGTFDRSASAKVLIIGGPLSPYSPYTLF